MSNPMYGQNKFDDILGNAKLLKNKLAYLSWNWQDLAYDAKDDDATDTGYTLQDGFVNGSLWNGDGAAASMVLPSATVGALVVFRFNAQADGGQSITFTTASGDYYEDGTLMLTVDNNGDGQLSQPNYLQKWVQTVATSGGTIVTTASTHNTLVIASTASNNQSNIGAEIVWFCEKAGYWKLAFKGSELGSGAVNATFATSAV